MEQSPFSSQEPDEILAQYERGLAVSGEDKGFFARGRVAFLRAWWVSRGLSEPQTVLDVGCGLGDAAPMLAEVFGRAMVLGLDPSPTSIANAQERYGSERVSFKVLSDAIREAPPRADLVHTNGVVHHVPVDKRPEFFRQLAGFCGADAVLALFENNPVNPGTRLVMSRIPFDRDAVPVMPWRTRRYLRHAGLRPIHTRHLFFFPGWLHPLRRLEPALTRVPLGAQYVVFAAAR